ncbi:homeobox-leucine zipper protein ATHB-52-like [Dorcoceras hygrometricum]|uniref:Homeobox-leucine zipper protein n=1 Tax=Dorcoceras hygrometricum TaxID=472368 RepID=A0A2Z7CWD4_9LAMI|nr:homeobox-leucine zipper protein ATHB-52-like [Dorcoceras hygrometricum]
MERSQYSQTQKQQPLIKNKKRLTQEQVRILETNFTFNNKLDTDRKHQLALELGVPARQVSIWYQNKRAREKNQSLEADHRALQQHLENVLAENTSLRGEVERLRGELCKIQELFSNGFNSSVSSSCDEVGSSKHDLEREYYAALIGAGQFAAFGGL